MTLFLLTFFLLYAGMHLYAFMKARAALAFGTPAGIATGMFLLLMMGAPFLIRLLERAGHEAPARVMALVGYTWLGALFLFTAYAAALDLYRLVLRGVGALANRDLSVFSLSAGVLFLVPLGLSLLTSVYGYVEALSIRTEQVTIETPKIPPAVGRIRIVQISDVHLGLLVRETRLRRIIGKVKEASPDILVSTGDLVDGDICRLNGLTDLLREVRPRYGKYAITGNHEFYAGLENSTCFTEDAGFTMLRGEAVPVTEYITMAGVDDPTARIYGLGDNVAEGRVLSGVRREAFTFLLKHRPLVDKEAAGSFDLQLSGHVHRGQIFPFSILTWLYYSHQSGLVRLTDASWLYVSRGTGTWGPPIRFLSPPEITIFDLVHKEHSRAVAARLAD